MRLEPLAPQWWHRHGPTGWQAGRAARTHPPAREEPVQGHGPETLRPSSSRAGRCGCLVFPPLLPAYLFPSLLLTHTHTHTHTVNMHIHRHTYTHSHIDTSLSLSLSHCNCWRSQDFGLLASASVQPHVCVSHQRHLQDLVTAVPSASVEMSKTQGATHVQTCMLPNKHRCGFKLITYVNEDLPGLDESPCSSSLQERERVSKRRSQT